MGVVYLIVYDYKYLIHYNIDLIRILNIFFFQLTGFIHIFKLYADLVFSSVWHFVFCSMGIVLVTVGRNKEQPGGSLSSVDRSPGSPRRCL